MCGIFGVSVNNNSRFSPQHLKATIKDLFLFSESRGKEASGLAILGDKQIEVLKSSASASEMIRSPNYIEFLNRTITRGLASDRYSPGCPFTIIGHSRLVTTGTHYTSSNNQPVIAACMVGIHNGIIVNHNLLWKKYSHLSHQYQVDTEIILRLIRMFYEQTRSLIEATQKTFEQIQGMASIAVLFEDLNGLLLATNNGALYHCINTRGDVLLFASERYILNRIQQRAYVAKSIGNLKIQQVSAGQGCFVNFDNFSIQEFSLTEPGQHIPEIACLDVFRPVVELPVVKHKYPSLSIIQKQIGLQEDLNEQTTEYLKSIKQRFPYTNSWQDSLQRCTRCILPETMPFIRFDNEGICNYCHNYKKLEFKGDKQLDKVIEHYRSRSNKPDCIVGISGGRDSLYCLHYVKKELNMNPIAYTYDWGMVTDLARRNISRICAKLGVEHIVVSANITKKRRFIKQNITAWLKKPDLGMIPLFMAGDKQYFYYLQQVRNQVGVHLAILGENMLERTDFKTGFTGVRPYNCDVQHVYTLPIWDRMRLAAYYGKQYILNPGYINVSLIDSLIAYMCYYFIDRTYLNLYNYIPWIEDVVVPMLIHEYDFELAPDTTTTWRIGDGTAAFYNYIYYNVAGFSEHDTFRSNQIREGLISREKALEQVQEENKPRYESIYWYLNIIELEIEMGKVLEIIHNIPQIQPSMKVNN